MNLFPFVVKSIMCMVIYSANALMLPKVLVHLVVHLVHGRPMMVRGMANLFILVMGIFSLIVHLKGKLI